MGKIKARWLVPLRSGPGTRLLLVLFAVLVIGIVFIGLDDAPGYILGYLATTAIFLALVRRWRSIKNYVILMLASFCVAVVLAGLHEEIIARIAVWIGGAEALESTPMHIIEMVIGNLILFAGLTGVAFGIIGALVLGILRLVGVKKPERTAGDT